MPSRYSYTRQLTTNETKKPYFESTIYPKIKATDSDTYIITEATDRLDLLAYKYYGDTSYWWVIAVANNINDATFYIDAGKQLRIPSNLSTIIGDLQKINK
jgi:phage tail protein X